jgi:hypothetical protein
MTLGVLDENRSIDRWDFWINHIADVPWGVVAFLIVVVLRASKVIDDAALTGLGSAAGLLGIGHGLHLGAKHLAQRANRPAGASRVDSVRT